MHIIYKVNDLNAHFSGEDVYKNNRLIHESVFSAANQKLICLRDKEWLEL